MRLWIMALSLMLIAPSSLATTPWQQVKQPFNGAPQSIGGFSNGCIVGAVALPLNSAHYQVMRSGQLRYFGHPDLIAFIHSVTKKAAQRRLGTVLIGDMSMPAGGRFSSGHASHQTGLDVDIWLQLPDERWSQKRLQNPKAIDLVDRSGKRVVDSLWQPQIGKLIKLAAQEQEVTRIFVHPAIKQRLCLEAGRDRAWLRKVRPWFGHRAHMHIRIACPKGSSDCIEQPLPPSGDGCGEELTSWLRDTSSLPTGKSASRPVPELPLQCQSLLENNFKLAQ